MATTKARAKLLNEPSTITTMDLCAEKITTSSRSNVEYLPDYAFTWLTPHSFDEYILVFHSAVEKRLRAISTWFS
jgi:hypothetical protein